MVKDTSKEVYPTPTRQMLLDAHALVSVQRVDIQEGQRNLKRVEEDIKNMLIEMNLTQILSINWSALRREFRSKQD